MKHLFWMGLMVAALAGLLTVMGQAQDATPEATLDDNSNGWLMYSAAGFQVDLPESWRDGAALLEDMEFLEQTADALGMDVNEYTQAFRLFVVDRDFYATDNAGMWLEIWQVPSATASLDEQYTQVRALQNGKIQVLSQEHFILPAGETARVYLRYTEPQSTHEVVTDILDFAIMTPDRIYHLTFHSCQTLYADHQAVFDIIARSFQMDTDEVETSFIADVPLTTRPG